MSLIDPNQLASMRQAAEGALSQQAVIHRCTVGNNGGQEVKTFTPDPNTTPCRVVLFKAPREVVVADQTRAFVDGLIKLPWNTALAKIDQIAVDDVFYDVIGDTGGRADATLLSVQVVRAAS